MKISILAIGRLRSGPEDALIRDYLTRFDAGGRALALGPARLAQFEDRKKRGREAESALLLDAIPRGAKVVALDERGKMLDSENFAARLGAWRDAGAPEAAFLIGGADGHAPAVRERADLTLSLGTMVWPHMLVRVMLAEQLYRAASILAGTPYHRA